MISEGLQSAINMGLEASGHSVLTPGNAEEVVAGLTEVNPTLGKILGPKILAAAPPLLAPSDNDVKLGYMRDMTFKIMKAERCPVDYVGFDRHKRSHHWDRTDKGYTEIRYGTQLFSYDLKYGYWEYPTVSHKAGVPRCFGPGMHSLHQIVLHEVAHSLVRVNGGAGRGPDGKRSTHGDKFVSLLCYLMEKYPYYEATDKEYAE